MATDAREDEDRDLIERAVGGDREAFSALASRYLDRVRAAAFRIAGNAADADDIAQEALLRAYQRLAGFDGRSQFFTWLYRIVINTALNHLRAARRQRDRTERSARELPEGWLREVDGQPDPERRAALRQRYERALVVFESLAEPLRLVVALVILDDVPYAQAAEILGIPRGTVAWRLNQARTILREAFGEAGEQDPKEHDPKEQDPSEHDKDDDLSGNEKSALRSS